MMNTPNHNNIADFFIQFAHDHGDCLTNLKLQKLVYYAQAWHLALYDKELFDADFEAWVHGPVCPSLYHRFKSFGWNPLSIQPDVVSLPSAIESHLVEVFKAYGEYSGYQLEEMTHKESPWRDARGNTPIDESSSAIIPKPAMKSYYALAAE